MAADLVLYTNPMSRGRIARWMLEEVGVPYETVCVEYGPPMKGPDYRRMNPMGKVPTLRHGDVVVTESAAICAYLADVFPEAGLAPPPGQRGAYYRWLFFGAGPVEAAVTNASLGFETPPDKMGRVGYGSLESVVGTLETAVAGDGYLAGPAFSAADVYLGSQIGWGLQFGSMPRRPAFEAYWARIADRPARARATALDDAAMPAPAS
jgi:glutathione S-transferase